MTAQINISEAFTIPNGAYDPIVSQRITRRGDYQIADGRVTVTHDYTIGGATYKVQSIFDLAGKKTVADGVRYLIDAAIDRAAFTS